MSKQAKTTKKTKSDNKLSDKTIDKLNDKLDDNKTDTKTNTIKIYDVKVDTIDIPNNDSMKKLLDIMKRNSVDNPIKLLPSVPRVRVTFKISAFVGFANALRRVLMEEIPVICLNFNEVDLETDDPFIIPEQLLKNINLLSIEQRDISTSLLVENKTNKCINVKASHMKNSDTFIPNSNVVICQLNPGKSINIKKISTEQGYGKDNAAKFSLLNSVKYNILDMVPYDMYTGKGQRSVTYDPKEFELSFETTGNINVKSVVKLMCDELRRRLIIVKDKLLIYMKTDQSKNLYFNHEHGFRVKVVDDIKHYEIEKEAITMGNMLSQECYLLDKNVLYCTSTIERYDNELCIIKIKHPDANNLLLMSIEQNIKFIDIVEKDLTSAL